MKTTKCAMFTKGFLHALEKAEWQEELHPRDATGKWSDKPGEVAVAERKQEGKLAGEARELRRQMSDLRAAGMATQARAVEDELKLINQRQGVARAASLPPQLQRPEPPPPPKPAPEAKDPLRHMRPAERDKESMRIREMGDAELRLRMRKITNPQKLKNFADVLEDKNYHQMAGEAREKLRKMGFDAAGRPVRAGEPAPRIRTPVAPVPPVRVRPAAPAAPRPAPPAPRPAPPAPAPVPPPVPQVVPLRRASPAERAHELDRVAKMDREKLLRRINSVEIPQKLKNFADALADRGHPNLARFAREKLLKKGWNADGSPVRAGAPAPAPARPVFPRPQPRPGGPFAVFHEPAPAPPPAPGPQWPRAVIDPKQQGAVNTKPETIRAAAQLNKSSIKDFIVGQKEMIGGGIGETHRIQFKDGTFAAWKPGKGAGLEKAREGTPEQRARGKNGVRGSLNASIPECERDLASYKISEAMGMGIVPYVEKADIGLGSGGEGHLMAWVDGEEAIKVHGQYKIDAREGHPDLHRIAALDFITGQTDRHDKNFMRGKDGRYYAIDNGLAFPIDSKVYPYISYPHERITGQDIHPDVKEEIAKLTPAKIRSAMEKGGFKDEDIEGAIARHAVLRSKDRWEKPDYSGFSWTKEASEIAKKAMQLRGHQ